MRVTEPEWLLSKYTFTEQTNTFDSAAKTESTETRKKEEVERKTHSPKEDGEKRRRRKTRRPRLYGKIWLVSSSSSESLIFIPD